MNIFMQEAINEAKKGINNHEGGPFGAVIVKDGNIIGKGHNKVLANNDPTCHGEIMAIHEACKNINSYDLSGCEIYTTGEPCNMCLTAIIWANINKVYFGCTIEDNEKIGFRDKKIDDIFTGREKLGDYLNQIDYEDCLLLFEEYNNMEHQIY